MKKNSTGSSVNSQDIDVRTRPQDDFYHHACGKWLKRNPIPKSEITWGSFYMLRDDNRKRIKKIFLELVQKKNIKKGSTSSLLRDFYLSGMDEKRIESLGITSLSPLFSRIDKVTTIAEFVSLLSRFHMLGIDVLWGPMVSLDEKNSDKMTLYVHQVARAGRRQSRSAWCRFHGLPPKSRGSDWRRPRGQRSLR